MSDRHPRVMRFHRVSNLSLGLVSVLLLAGSSPAGAVDKFAAEFLKIGIGARALGMGGAFVSVADDASAAYWNPAGLVQLEEREAMLMGASQFGGVVDHDAEDAAEGEGFEGELGADERERADLAAEIEGGVGVTR